MSLLVKGKLPKVLLMMMPICCFLFSVLAQESPSETTVSNEIGTLTGTNSLSASNSTSYSDYPYSVRTIRSAPKEYLERRARVRSSIIWGGVCLNITIAALFFWGGRHKIWILVKAIRNKQS
jgi:hypothetical protein